MEKAENVAKILKGLFKQEDLNKISNILETIAEKYIELQVVKHNDTILISNVAQENEKYLQKQLTTIAHELKIKG